MTRGHIEQAPPAEQLPITVAPMRRRHLARVMETEAQVYTRPWTRSLFESELGRPESRCYLIARSGAVVVGHCGVLFQVGEGHVTTIAVDPVFQRRHIATRLMVAQLRAAIGRGATAMTLEVRVGNKPAQELYRRFGFAPAGIRPRYYPDNGEDAIIMWLHDLDGPECAARLASIEATFVVAVDGGGSDEG